MPQLACHCTLTRISEMQPRKCGLERKKCVMCKVSRSLVKILVSCRIGHLLHQPFRIGLQGLCTAELTYICNKLQPLGCVCKTGVKVGLGWPPEVKERKNNMQQNQKCISYNRSGERCKSNLGDCVRLCNAKTVCASGVQESKLTHLPTSVSFVNA